MNAQSQTTESRQTLERLARSGPDLTEKAVAASPGSIAQVLAAKVKSLSSYNVYNVSPVAIGLEGSLPIEVGGEIKAFNLAESFTQAGQLPAGTCIVVCRVGDKNVFYAKS